MPNTLQFVDSIASSPTVRLDVADNVKWWLNQDPDFSPPTLLRSVVSTLLRDGAEIPASAYDNRTLTLKLSVMATTKDLLATELQKLNRELDRANNILKWQPVGASAPVFFRTFRSPDYKLESSLEVQNVYDVTLTLVAEPFAYGLRVDQGGVTVNNDPAAGSNPCYWDVTGITGDVETPAFIKFTGTTQQDRPSLLATRRRGTPGGVYITQCEAMTLGTDTTLPGADATASGAGSSYARTSFGTSSSIADMRLDFPFPASGANVEYRGTYKLMLRCRRSGTTSVLTAQMRDSAGSFAFAGPIVTVPALGGAGWMWIDLGEISMPLGQGDPIWEGYSNVAQSVQSLSSLVLGVGRSGGSDTFDWDVVIAVPADEELAIIDWQDGGANTDRVVDGPRDHCYTRNATPALVFQEPLARVGDLPMLSPNQTNRIVFLRNVGGGIADDKTLTQTATLSFWPRFLYIRP